MTPDKLPPTLLRATDPAEWSALMAAAQDGDTLAYRRLLGGIAPYLRAIAARALGHGAEVEDCVQDILLTLHAIRHTYDPVRPFKPWLAGIARHRLIDRLRARGRQARREVRIDFADALFAAPEAEPGTAIDHDHLHARLATLPPGQREAVTLLKLREMSLAEASQSSGQSVGALKVAVHRGLKALRRLLQSPDGAP